MANCTPSSLSAAAECLSCGLTHKQLLAAIVYLLCKGNNMSCDPKTLVAGSECIRCSMTERQMLAAMVFLLCNGGPGGGTGGGGDLVFGQIVVYVGVVPVAGPANINAPAIAYKNDGSTATYTWNLTTKTWQ